ncbi:lipopolysaccharide-induced tumor necrosis factor-alpha factor homolog [Athalia rosae]|uniref:lipopolysaccharide-induced tumor necrosis factor-alpha factor homolog n=1 Tax=Athalia rosae TaxID=37344 RepID=UPI0020343869|nr:lipopolysaccharide-induced tumor necrosis factor-alpha factor homolog [Athalia rosae]XP_012253224.2 lipopolysaccharide-induced tumor necrosis factor-alpha factor homolog [Athalia rosae]XP_048510244.1 lipopolysaccharide-induced tumor necrosis factor-alpha factor homolog [Athalia rosae]XP_048510245.1 lipopolysaccharide-induced tumor necrosis factor-alpha factor homolog [Athalia rosae]
MEKGEGPMGGSGIPPPTAPPSYDEAMTNAPLPYPPPNSAQFPIQGMQMPMPASYGQPSTAMPMPMPMTTSHAQPKPQQVQPGCQYPQQNIAPQAYAPPPTQITYVQQTVAYALGPNSVKMTCPTCRADIKTTTVSDHQASAHICCIILCLLGFCLCSCLPYCMSAFMSVHHSCPNCKTYIGTWKG